MQPSKLDRHQDLYEPKHSFDMHVKFCEHIIQNFPTLSPSTVRVISKSIINKLTEGVEYSKELEDTISHIYPILIQSLSKNNNDKTLSK
jgi:hypothetical protein